MGKSNNINIRTYSRSITKPTVCLFYLKFARRWLRSLLEGDSECTVVVAALRAVELHLRWQLEGTGDLPVSPLADVVRAGLVLRLLLARGLDGEHVLVDIDLNRLLGHARHVCVDQEAVFGLLDVAAHLGNHATRLAPVYLIEDMVDVSKEGDDAGALEHKRSKAHIRV